jgi:hypothetical protein
MRKPCSRIDIVELGCRRGARDGGHDNTSRDREGLLRHSGRCQGARSRIRKMHGKCLRSVHDRPGIRGMLHCGTTANPAIRSWMQRRELLSMGTAPSGGRRRSGPGLLRARAEDQRLIHRVVSGRILAYSAGAPTVSAIAAPRPPRGLSPWTVLSFAVWCSISALSSAPNKITIAEIHIHIIRPIAAPSDP